MTLAANELAVFFSRIARFDEHFIMVVTTTASGIWNFSSIFLLSATPTLSLPVILLDEANENAEQIKSKCQRNNEFINGSLK